MISQLNSRSFLRAIGMQCILGSTNHPNAAQYQGQFCRIIAVRQMQSYAPMVSVQFPDGTYIQGLFFGELENAQGHPLKCSDFELR